MCADTGHSADFCRGLTFGDPAIRLVDAHLDWRAGHGSHADYRIVGASAIGHLHLRDGLRRDDAFAVRGLGRWLTVAVADGAGSRPHSRIGACYCAEMLSEALIQAASPLTAPLPVPQPQDSDATHPGRLPSPPADPQEARRPPETDLPGDSTAPGDFSLAAYLPVFGPEPSDTSAQAGQHVATVGWNRNIPEPAHPRPGSQHSDFAGTPPAGDLTQAVEQAFATTHAGLKDFIHSRRQHLRDVPCTLLGLIMDTTTGQFACGQIGDGAITALHRDGRPQVLLTPPSPGETGETYVITQTDWHDYLAVDATTAAEAATIATLLVMTDGVADDAILGPPADQFTRWSQSMDRELRARPQLSSTAIRLLRFLATYEVPGSWDDRTLVAVLAPRPCSSEPLPPADAAATAPDGPGCARPPAPSLPK